MRITQIMLGKGFGGAERSFVDTALALAARGHEVQAICHRKFIKRNLLENVPGLRLDSIKAGGELDVMAPRRIAKLIRAFNPEIPARGAGSVPPATRRRCSYLGRYWPNPFSIPSRTVTTPSAFQRCFVRISATTATCLNSSAALSATAWLNTNGLS
jgi:hypothetical protein